MKKLLITAAIVIVAASAYAQSSQEFNLKVDAGDLGLIGKALGKMPFDEVSQLMGKLQAQINAQTKAKTEPKAPQPKGE